jgi:hypothetical protein
MKNGNVRCRTSAVAELPTTIIPHGILTALSITARVFAPKNTSMFSDEDDIKDVMQDEIRAGRGKPPIHSTNAEQIRRIRAGMLKAITECNEQDFINCVLALGHGPESEEYKRMMNLWYQSRGRK